MRRFLLLFCAFFSLALFAQTTPEQVMKQFLDKEQQSLLSTDFSCTMQDEVSQPLTYSGHIDMLGEKFILTMLESEVAYDGTTLYMYTPDIDELTLSHPSHDDLLTLNPIMFAKALMPKCTLRFSPKANQQTAYVIDFTPKDQSSGIQSFTLRLSRATLVPESITIREQRQTTTLRLSKATYSTQKPAFTLSKPTAFINDLR